MYSLGVLLHLMITAEFPTQPLLQPATCTSSMMAMNGGGGGITAPRGPPRGEVELSKLLAEAHPAMKIIRALLDADPDKRPTCAELLRHPWIRSAMYPSGSMKSFLFDLIPWKKV